jgi:glycosyltransferase involved in cell wall biosynthesis
MEEQGAMSEPVLSVVLPCLNEERTVASCVRKCQRAFAELGLPGEVVVVDNNSTDRSGAVAEAAGARVVRHQPQGYGSALKRGIAEAKGQYIFMGDADDTYDFLEIAKLLPLLRDGADLAIGSRLRGKIHAGAMPFVHRHFGTPMLTWILNRFFGSHISDTNCGMRGFTRAAIDRLDLRCNGMEFASEMVVKAAQAGFKIAEAPVDYYASLPGRLPNLHSLRDGWRHLRFMLVLCPEYLFVFPGLLLMIAGVLILAMMLLKDAFYPHLPLGLSTMMFGGILSLLGLQVALLGVYAIVSNSMQGLGRENRLARAVTRVFKLEWALIASCVVLFAGIALGLGTIVLLWQVAHANAPVNVPVTKLAILSSFLFLLGLQLFFSAFYLSLANLRRTLE